jgi:hypothetical protein
MAGEVKGWAVAAGDVGAELGGCGTVLWRQVRRELSGEGAVRCCGGR